MTVYLFGAISSPSISSFALHQTIQDHKDKFDDSIGEIVLTSFYVDDFLDTIPSEEEAVNVV